MDLRKLGNFVSIIQQEKILKTFSALTRFYVLAMLFSVASDVCYAEFFITRETALGKLSLELSSIAGLFGVILMDIGFPVEGGVSPYDQF